MKQLTTKLLLSLAAITLIYLTSCNGADGELVEPEMPTLTWRSLPFAGSPGEVITLEGNNLNSSQKFEIIINQEFSVTPTILNENTLSFTVPDNFSSGPMEVIANEESVMKSYFRFLDENEKPLMAQVNVSAYDFIDVQNGIYLDDRDILYRTTDGGSTWNAIGQGAYQNVVYAVSDRKIWKQKDHRTLEKTEDGGNTWQEVQISDDLLIDHYYASTEVVVVIATFRDENISRLYTSADNGESWEVALTSEDPTFDKLRHHKVVYQNGDQIVLLDMLDRSILKSVESGHWEQSQLSGLPNIGLREKGVFFLSEELIWYSAMGGLAKSVDGGKSIVNYDFSFTESSDLVGRVHFYNVMEGVAVTSDGGVIRTHDGGESWNFTHVEGDIVEADFLDEEKAMILIQDQVPGGRRMVKLQF
ncbi:MAG: IPT/TIG domain-containing protein [Bacteroidota bacterium]